MSKLCALAVPYNDNKVDYEVFGMNKTMRHILGEFSVKMFILYLYFFNSFAIFSLTNHQFIKMCLFQSELNYLFLYFVFIRIRVLKLLIFIYYKNHKWLTKTFIKINRDIGNLIKRYFPKIINNKLW